LNHRCLYRLVLLLREKKNSVDCDSQELGCCNICESMCSFFIQANLVIIISVFKSLWFPRRVDLTFTAVWLDLFWRSCCPFSHKISHQKVCTVVSLLGYLSSQAGFQIHWDSKTLNCRHQERLHLLWGHNFIAKCVAW
jgi:hypothetical protein